MTLEIVLTAAALAFLCAIALLWSRWPGWLKGLLLVGVTAFYFQADDLVHRMWGFPSPDRLPERFVLLAAVIDEPNAKTAGALYVWVNAIENGKPVPEPRALRFAPLLLALAACHAPPPSASYFPLDGGHRWAYDMSTERENGSGVEHEAMVLSTLGRESIDGGDAWRRHADSGVDYWLRADDSGIWRVAAKSDLDAEPQPDKERRYVLKAPLAAGTEWRATTTAYLLERRQEFPREIRHTHAPVAMTYTIDATGQSLDTRAGRFDDCLRVRGRAVMRLYADPVAGWRDVPLATTEWYCKGVGLVRLVREEPANSSFLSGGTLTMELTEWQ
jgi:hypothetical protein